MLAKKYRYLFIKKVMPIVFIYY